MQPLLPPLLKKGDQIRILSTARSVARPELEDAISLWEDWGFRVSIGSSIGKKHHQFAGKSEDRLSDLQSALDDPAVKAIWCARGGYGTIEIIDGLDWSSFLKNPKWIMGYSDVTILHRAIQQQGCASLHSFMCLEMAQNSRESRNRFRESVTQEIYTFSFRSERTQLQNPIKGKIVGGNLSILYSLLGSNLAELQEDSILFLEEIDEYLYHVDRMLRSLLRSRTLSSIKALCVGGFTQMNDHEIPFGKDAYEMLQALAADLGVPIVYDVPCGHLADHAALRLGCYTVIEQHDQEVKLVQYYG